MPTIVPVNTPGGDYDVRIGRDLIAHAGEALAPLGLGKKIAIIVDQTVATLCGEEPFGLSSLLKSLSDAGFEIKNNNGPNVRLVPAGELSKNTKTYAEILSFLAERKLDRQSTVIALGGGVIGDLTGFAAATYLRGVNFVQIPTTLLAMVDSSVGGKTGVNLPEGKNLVGAFYQPRLVLADIGSIATLPPRELAAGMAEVIKHGLIRDPQLFDRVATGTPTDADWETVIQRNVEIKAAVVNADERETTGLRAILNFGHTIGHAIEAVAGYGTLLHGEAVAVGMRAAAHLSHLVLGLPESDVRRIEAAIAANHLPLHFDGGSHDKLLDVMSRDKKVKAGTINWVLLPKIGEAKVTTDVPPEAVTKALEIIRTEPNTKNF